MLIRKRSLVPVSPPLTALEWAYFGGLLDGEGSITIVRFNARNYGPRITMTNVDLPLLLWVHDRFRGARLYLFDQPSAVRNQNARPIYRLDWTGRQVPPLLAGVRSYLRLKAPQADEVVAFLQCRAVTDRKPYERWPDATVVSFAEAHQRVKQLNRRGRL